MIRPLLGCILLLISFWVHADEPITVTVAKGDHTFQVTLPSNPTTGYNWSIKNYDRALFKLIASHYIGPKNQLIGAGGNMVFTFAIANGVARPKSSEMVFIYARPWRPEVGPLKTVNIRM